MKFYDRDKELEQLNQMLTQSRTEGREGRFAYSVCHYWRGDVVREPDDKQRTHHP